MYFNKKTTNKFLIVASVFLILINLLVPVAKAYAQNIETSSAVASAHFNSEVQCLAENIYYESASESFEGKLAVAQVTINRVDSGKFASTICGVVKQKDHINGRIVCQFSWFCNQAYTKLIRNPYQWDESVTVAKKALTSAIAHDILYKEKAMFYHANYVNPGWNLTRVTQIGNHIFYKEKNRI
jgi:spore germination cell wall hydrolase CwlJ-like protein